MEVGAVKQAFNNELILLKKNLNQAKTQIIHKLTRKAKTLTEKKAPDHLKEKLKRKAEAAVREVLIIKKIKTRDIGKFIVTHTGKLQDFLNKPEVDQNKACARILLHKAMQEKYALIRNRFSDVPIKDLFISRQERLKLKKEARQKQKEKEKKKREKQKRKTKAGEVGWNVEDVKTGDESKVSVESNVGLSDDDGELSDKESNGEEINKSGLVDENIQSEEEVQSADADDDYVNDANESEGSGIKEESDENDEQSSVGRFVRLKPIPKGNVITKKPSTKKETKQPIKDNVIESLSIKHSLNTSKATIIEIPETKLKIIEHEIKKKQEKKAKDNKNKNFNEKILQRKFKKDLNEPVLEENKIVDPFFITSTGEKYMSVAEPRLPDEVKEIHKQGNRKHRRAVMFGHVPKQKYRNNQYTSKDNYNNKFNINNKFENDRNDRFNKPDKFNRNDKFNSNFKKDLSNNFSQNKSDSNFNGHNGFKRKRLEDGPSDTKRTGFREDRNPVRSNQEDTKEEKLHPSWEAKKRQSGILPFQGKKIVFNDD